jgi:hypothetical protein
MWMCVLLSLVVFVSSYLAMASVARLPGCTVEDALKTAETTCNEYENASQKLASDANALLLLPLSLPLDRVRERLESIVDDEEIRERLENITIARPDNRSLMSGLDVDMQAICTYLQNAGSNSCPLKKAEVDVYAQALTRYGEVLKTVRNKNVK